MDYHSNLQQEIHTRNVYLFDDQLGNEDDIFYDELRRQVLQLTAEDEDEDEQVYYNKNIKIVEARKKCMNKGPNGVTQGRNYYNWPGNKEDYVAAPAWISNLWRSTGNNNGTGVFIPQMINISQSTRRKNKPRRKKNERGRTYKWVQQN